MYLRYTKFQYSQRSDRQSPHGTCLATSTGQRPSPDYTRTPILLLFGPNMTAMLPVSRTQQEDNSIF